MKTKKVALLTTFYEARSGYSLVTVAETQIGMLLDRGYDPVVLVQEDFKQPDAPSVWREESVDLKPVIPQMDLSEEVSDDFEARVKRVLAALSENLGDVDVCVTHDVMFQKFYMEHNVAVRKYAKTRPDLLWLHWTHSCPTPVPGPLLYPHNCRHTPPPGYVVYPNDSDKGIVCSAYGLGGLEWRVKVCRAGHSLDPFAAWPYDGLTRNLVEKADLLDGEVVAVYPARLDGGKQVEKIVRLMAGVEKAGYEPRLLVVDWQSLGDRFMLYKEYLSDLSSSLGLEGKVSFTSRLDDACSQGVPRKVVMELFDFSNVYVHPSAVETYSLVVHEAALRGNLLVLNHDFPAMRELFGESAIYMDFGSDRTGGRAYEPNEQAFWNDEAIRLVVELRQNRALWARSRAQREWSPKAMWREFEPLLYLVPVGE